MLRARPATLSPIRRSAEQTVTADFPDAEFEARLDRAQRAMRTERLDALLFTTEAEVRYFTGFRTPFWQSPTRPWFLVIPSAGKPVAVIPEIGRALMAATWIDDIRSWASPAAADDGVSLLADALTGFARIGMPMGRETTLRMPLGDFDALRARLAGAEFVDATPIVQRLRMVKSPAEIAKLQAICQVAGRAFDRAGDLFHAGQPLAGAFRAFRIELLRQGAEDVPYLVGGAGPDGYADVISPPGATPLAAGDVLMLDTGATLDGYFCDFDRNFAIGRASDAARRAHATLHEAVSAALDAARPGARCRDLHRAMAAVVDQPASAVGRFGHGLGLQLTEPPSLIDFDETELAPGMVLTLEPSMTAAPGRIMVAEENIVVTDGPPLLLTARAPADLPIL